MRTFARIRKASGRDRVPVRRGAPETFIPWYIDTKPESDLRRWPNHVSYAFPSKLEAEIYAAGRGYVVVKRWIDVWDVEGVEWVGSK